MITDNSIILRTIAIVLFLSVWNATSVDGQTDEKPLSLMDVMNFHKVINLTIVANIDSIYANKTTEKTTEGTFSFKLKKGKSYSFKVELKTRGRFRRAICDLPPLKLNLQKKELRSAGFHDYDEFKLVTYCLENDARSRELVLREYLVYKLYNAITPFSYRVQLVKLTIEDVQQKGKKINTWAFLIEDDKEFAKRLGVKECECLGQTPDNLDDFYEKLNAVFQFMIGNTDWDILMLRNVKLMEKEDGKLAPVPYDFDFSVIVRAPYLRPNQDVGQSIKMERIYMGMRREDRDMQTVTAYFRSKKGELIRIIEGFRELDSYASAEMVQYLESFYSMIDRNELSSVYFPAK